MDASSSITRTIVVNAPKSAVWAAITDPDKISRWFGQRTSLNLSVGGKATFTWDEHGTARTVITEIDEPNAFGFRWAADIDADPVAGNSTLVRFTLSEHDSGTELTVVESGFDTLDRDPADQKRAREANTEGWKTELGELSAYLGGVNA